MPRNLGAQHKRPGASAKRLRQLAALDRLLSSATTTLDLDDDREIDRVAKEIRNLDRKLNLTSRFHPEETRDA